jgi:hypothetical protein
MTARADLPRLEDLPVPDDVRALPSWPESMREMADHIGARATLRVCEELGGQDIYIPLDPARSPMRTFLSQDELATIAHVYGGTRYSVPLGKTELTAARRAGVIAAVRAGQLTVTNAAIICRSTRSYLSHLVNQTDEGRGARIAAAIPKRLQHDPRQIDMFSATDDGGQQPQPIE